MQTESINKKNEISTEKRKENKDKIENNTRTSFSKYKLKVNESIETPHSNGINSVCLLKDKRLVSGGKDKLIIVYNHSHEPQIQIKNAHKGGILSLCGLKNGDLASSSFDKIIKIWRIGENDYELIHTLIEHTDSVNKVIELEDGRICSCSDDKTIKIWDNYTYQSITTIKAHTDEIISIIEINDSIISVSYKTDKTLRRWNKSTYECIKIIQNVECCWCNALEKLNNHTVLIGVLNLIFAVDIESSEVKKKKDSNLGLILCFRVIRNDLVLFGNEHGNIYEYNPISNEILSRLGFQYDEIRCLIKAEENQIISSSIDSTIKVYESICDDSA